jgi:hypothetical protein
VSVVSSPGAVGLISSKIKTLAQLQVFLRRVRGFFHTSLNFCSKNVSSASGNEIQQKKAVKKGGVLRSLGASFKS